MEVQRIQRRGVVRSYVFGLQPLWRSALSSMLEWRSIGPVTICRTLDELVLVDENHPRPQLLVADPDSSPAFVEKLVELLTFVPRLTIVVVTGRADDACFCGELLEAGVAAVISKDLEVAEIEEAIHAVIEERIQCSRLTAREIEILRLVADGLSNREVAASLWLSDQTVKFHLANAYRKLGVASRSAAVEGARREGLLPIPSTGAARGDVEDGGGLAAAAAL